jgi:hypothetical protein
MLLSEIFFRVGLTVIVTFATVLAYVILNLRVNPTLADHTVIVTVLGGSALLTAVGIIVSAVAYVWGYPFIVMPS